MYLFSKWLSSLNSSFERLLVDTLNSKDPGEFGVASVSISDPCVNSGFA